MAKFPSVFSVIRFVAAVMFLLGAIASARERIAILADAPSLPLADLLTAELGSRANLELVERNDIERVMKEHALSATGRLEQQLSLAALLHADGLLILDNVSFKEGQALSVRLTASGPGVVIGSELFALRKDDPRSLAGDIARKFEPLWPKLAVTRDQATPISLLNLRCVVKTTQAEQLESQLTFLLGRRLMAQPELFVLERWRLDDAAFEKAVGPVDEGAFWNGSYIVDGEIETSAVDPTRVKVKVFVRPPRGAGVKTVEAHGEAEQLPELVNTLASRLVGLFAKQPVTNNWSPLEESREYAREADWAFRFSLFHLAHNALEASWALGNRDPELHRLRVKIYGELAYPATYHYDPKSTDVSADPKRIRFAQLALDSFSDSLAHPAPDRDYKDGRVFVGCEALLSASRVLRNGYEHGMRDDRSLANLRAGVRKLFPVLLSWVDPDSRGGDWPRIGRWGPELIAAIYYPFWYETPMDQAAACRDLLRWSPPPRLRYHAALLRENLLERRLWGDSNESSRAAPWLAGWNGESQETLDAAWREFLPSLLCSSEKTEQLDGALLQFATERDQASVLLPLVMERLWDAREELVLGNLAGAYVSSLHHYLCFSQKLPHVNPSALFERAYRVKWLVYYLEHANGEDAELLNTLWKFDQFTAEDAAAVYKAWRGFRERLDKTHAWTRSAGDCTRYESDLLAVFPQLVPARLVGSLPVTRFWMIPEFHDAEAKGPRFMEAAWCGGKLWLYVSTITTPSSPDTIYGIDLPSFTVRDRIMVLPRVSLGDPCCGGLKASECRSRFHASAAAFYIMDSNTVQRYDRANNTWTTLTLPERGAWTAMQAAGRDLFIARSGNYVANRSCGIWKWITSTGELEVICSSRRRPARNAFDDRDGYLISSLFPGPDGKLGVSIPYWGYFYSPATGQWEPFRESGQTIAYPVVSEGTTVIVSHPGSVGLIQNGKGIEWCKDRGVLSASFADVFYHRGDIETMVGYVNGTLWVTAPRGLNPSHTQMLRRIDWANPGTAAPPIPLDFQMPAETQQRIEQAREKHDFGNLVPADRLRMIVTEKGIVFWEFVLPGFWFIPMKDLENHFESLRKHRRLD